MHCNNPYNSIQGPTYEYKVVVAFDHINLSDVSIHLSLAVHSTDKCFANISTLDTHQ